MLLVFCMLVGYSRFKVKHLLWLYTVVLAMMGYFYFPYKTSDLYRIFEYLETFKNINFHDFFHLYVVSSSAPIGRLLYWSIAKIGDYHLLPMFAACVSYGCVFYILSDCAERFKATRSTVALVLFYYMSIGHYLSVVSNIRTMMAVCMIAVCFYRETVHKRFFILHIPIYALAMGLHNLAIVFLLIRLAAIIFASRASLWARIFVVVSLALAAMLVQFLLPTLVGGLLDKAMDYMYDETYVYVWEYLMGAIVLILQFYYLYLYKRAKVESRLSLRTENSALILAILLSLIFATTFTFFYRLVSCIVAILSIPLLTELIGSYNARRISRKIALPLRLTTFVFSLAELALSCTRGSLCGLKFFEFGG